MKTFKQMYKESSYSYAMGNYKPIADLNAAAGDAPLTKQDLDAVEKYADRLYKSVGIDVEFTKHFLDRVNDAKNKKKIILNGEIKYDSITEASKITGIGITSICNNLKGLSKTTKAGIWEYL